MATSDITTFDSATEEWRDVPGYEGIYQVSDLGRLIALPRADGFGIHARAHIRKPDIDKTGYVRVLLGAKQSGQRWLMHRLVLFVFRGSPTADKPDVNHKNGIRDDNRLSNLEYCSRQENTQDAIARRGNWMQGEKNARALLTEEIVKEIKRRRSNGEQGKQLAMQYGITPCQVSSIYRGRTWKHVEVK